MQVRTSGYSRFADVPIPEDVRNGSKKVDIVGILSRYQGSAQFTLLDVFYSGTINSIIKEEIFANGKIFEVLCELTNKNFTNAKLENLSKKISLIF